MLRNIQRKHIPDNIIDFLKKVSEENFSTVSLHGILKNMDDSYDEWAQKKFDEQNDYTLKADSENPVRLVYNRDDKRFVLKKD